MTNETAPERIVNTQTEEAQRVQGSVMASAAHLSTQRFQGWVNPIVASCKDAADMIGALASERDTIQSRLEAAQAEIQRCHERLEITHEFKMRDEHSGLERVEIPYEKRQKKPDGIECRDATIALLEQSNKAAQARIAELEGQNQRLIEDRARFPDRPDWVGDMIGAHYKNMETRIQIAERHTSQYGARLWMEQRKTEKLTAALENIVTWGNSDHCTKLRGIARAALEGKG